MGFPRTDSCSCFGFQVQYFTDTELLQYDAKEKKMALYSWIPVIGQWYVWTNQAFFDLDPKIPQQDNPLPTQNPKTLDRICRKVCLRKFSIKILEDCFFVSVIHSIGLTILWALLIYAETKSVSKTYSAIKSVYTVFNLMTIPSIILYSYNKMKLKAENAIKKQHLAQLDQSARQAFISTIEENSPGTLNGNTPQNLNGNSPQLNTLNENSTLNVTE